MYKLRKTSFSIPGTLFASLPATRIAVVALPLTTAIIAFLIYLITLAPDLTWSNFGGDGGELITSSMTFGVPHPSGYPTYILLGKLFSLLPVGTIAYRYNLFSAAAMALTAGFITATAMHIYGRAGIGKQPGKDGQPGQSKVGSNWASVVAAGLTFALLPLVWSQALIAEVYALNLVFLSALLWALFVNRSIRRPLLIGLLLGFSITTHLTSLFMVPLILLLAPKRMWPKLFLGTLIGLVPFLLLPLLARSQSPVVWSQPDTVDGWWWLISGRIYRPNVFSVPLVEWPGRLLSWGQITLVQVTVFALPIVALGLGEKWLSERRKLFLLLLTSLLYIIYALGYRSNDAIVFMLPSLLLLSIPLALGLKRLGWVSIALPLILVALNLNSQNLSLEPAVRDNAEGLLSEAPKRAILLTPGDQTIATMWYLRYVENMRTDLTIVDQNMFQFDWYRRRLGKIDPTLLHLKDDDLDGFRHQNQGLRPICEIALVDQVNISCSFLGEQFPGATS